MKRTPIDHERVFSDEDYATRYAQQHQKMAENLGWKIAKKLHSRGFQEGSIVDVGCGSGGTAVVLAQEFPQSEVVGIDLSEPLIRLANQSVRSLALDGRVRFETGDAEHIPYEEDSFDVVLNLNMVHIVERPIQMLDEIERILVPDGALFIVDLRRSWLGLFETEMKSALTPREAKTLFAQTTLRVGSFSSSLIWWRFEA